MQEDARTQATEFLKELYAAGDIDADRFDAGVDGLLAATSGSRGRGSSGSAGAPP